MHRGWRLLASGNRRVRIHRKFLRTLRVMMRWWKFIDFYASFSMEVSCEKQRNMTLPSCDFGFSSPGCDSVLVLQAISTRLRVQHENKRAAAKSTLTLIKTESRQMKQIEALTIYNPF